MSEKTGFFSDQGTADDFVLPGDDKILAAMRDQEEAETPVEQAPAPAVEPVGDSAGDPEDEPAAAPEPAAEPAPELILGKFKSNDELAAAYQELEASRGRQANEIGELRQMVEQVREQTAPQPQPQQQYDPEAIADHFAENPHTVLPTIQQAYSNGDMNTVYLGLAALEDTDRPLAEGLRIEIAKRAALTEMQEQMRPALAQAETADSQARVRDMVVRYPDFNEFLQGDGLAELANQFPVAKRAIVEGTAEDRFSALETLYLIHRGRVSDNLDGTVRDVARTAAQEAQTMREEAFVASATATTAPPKRSQADEYAAGWDDKKDLFENGWNIGNK